MPELLSRMGIVNVRCVLVGSQAADNDTFARNEPGKTATTVPIGSSLAHTGGVRHDATK